MEQALKPPVVLDWYLGYLSCWLRNLGVPGWSDAVLTETLRYDETHGLPCAMESLFTVETYRARFTALCTSGWPWIGLHAVGLLHGRLLLSLELPDSEPGQYAATSVNLSGPTRALAARSFVLDDLITGPPPAR